MRLNRLYEGDALELLECVPDGIIDLTVTSPPYDGLRLYDGSRFDFEPFPALLYRVTVQGGIVVWVVGDETKNGSETGTSFKQALAFMDAGFKLHDTMIYRKKNPVPCPGQARYAQCFEYMFVFSKGKPKTFNPIMVRCKNNLHSGTFREREGGIKYRNVKNKNDMRPRRNIWAYGVGRGVTTKDDVAFGHPAMFPEKLALDHIMSWSNEGDLVLDPFAGAGTVLKMAALNGRNFLGFEISGDYCAIARERLAQYGIMC